jgi:hypothetical protein
VDHPRPSSAKVKERVELYVYSDSGPLCPVLECTLLYLPIPTCFELHSPIISERTIVHNKRLNFSACSTVADSYSRCNIYVVDRVVH